MVDRQCYVTQDQGVIADVLRWRIRGCGNWLLDKGEIEVKSQLRRQEGDSCVNSPRCVYAPGITTTNPNPLAH